jgi:branched-chain amino acid transport system ATP-binding protein
VGNPELMLLDEPSEGIQPSIVQMICEVLTSIRDQLGATILFVEQNLDMIMALTRRCYVMDKGRIVAELPSTELGDPETVNRHLQI